MYDQMPGKTQLIIGGTAKAIRRKNLLSEVLRLTRVSERHGIIS